MHRSTAKAIETMIRKPDQTEWDTSALPAARRADLDADLSFEDIASRVVLAAKIVGSRIEPYDSPPPGAPKNVRQARQAVYIVRVGQEISDLFYSARDGLRARYWQSPHHGFAATRYLINLLLPSLMLSAERYPPTCGRRTLRMNLYDIEASLKAPSAKIWPRERDDDGNYMLDETDQLLVPRWAQSEKYAPRNKGMWRRRMRGNDLQIKGALLQTDQTEEVPTDKRDRSCQLFRYGFT